MAVKVSDFGARTSFNKPRKLMIKGYSINGCIQFHEKKKHFRTLKFYGAEKGTVLDGADQIFLENKTQREKVYNEEGWTDYILWMRKWQNFEEEIENMPIRQ